MIPSLPELFITRTNIDSLIELFTKAQKTDIAALLIDYKRTVFKINELTAKSLELKIADPASLREVQKKWGLTNISDNELSLGNCKFDHSGCIELPARAGDKPIVRVGSKIFSNCREIIIPDGYRYLFDQAFVSLPNLEKNTLPDTLVSIGKSAFRDCQKLRELIFSDQLLLIGDNTFNGCTSLEYIKLPANIRFIEEKTFLDCENLQEVQLGENVVSIGKNAFANCHNLKKINLPESLRYIAPDAFPKTLLKSLGLADISDYASLTASTETPLTYRLSSGENLDLPGIMLAGNKTIVYRKRNADDPSSIPDAVSLVLPEGIISIRENSFINFENLEGVILGSDLVYIETNAFANCRNLRTIKIPDSVRLIEAGAFQRCENLVMIELGANIQEIYHSAFQNCPRLIISAPKGSYAIEFARKYELPYKEI
ncbi:MAG: leucine-rich repeat domain-containing protein [Chloroflexota bacterium]